MNRHDEFLAGKASLPDWFDYPAEFRSLVKHGAVNFAPWHLADVDFALTTYSALTKKYGRELFPVAYHKGSDDVLCVEKGRGSAVVIINGHTNPGEENVRQFDSIWSWFRDAVDEMINFHS